MSLPSITLPYTKDKSATPRLYVIQVYDPEINTDSNADPGDPIASIIVERTEELEYLDDRKTISSARIRLSYELITTRQNYHLQSGGEFCGSYSIGYGGNERVSITSPSLSTGAVYMAIEGLGGPKRECKYCGSLLTVIHSAGRWGSWWIILKLSLLHSGYSWSFNNVTLCG